MKGNNQLHLNQQTIVEALQEYLSSRYRESITVKSVNQQSMYNGDAVFVVEVLGHCNVISVSGEQISVSGEQEEIREQKEVRDGP